MDCRALRQLTLKSDGNLSCDDSAGYPINLAKVTDIAGWSLTSALRNSIFSHVRRAFAEGRPPWPGVCETCDLFSPGGAPLDTLFESVAVQVEPTLACALKCPSCNRPREVRRRPADEWMLPLPVYRNFLRSAVADRIELREIQYIGWGEPLDHTDFPALVAAAREISPATRQLVHTSGNASVDTAIADAPLDRVVVSCDGATPTSYPKYRRGGDLTTVIRFMRDMKKRRPDVHLEWKYILFDFNDTVAETSMAQQIADDLGVDSMLFVMTNTKRKSKRYTDATLHQLPLKSGRVEAAPAAALQKIRGVGRIDASRSRLGAWSGAHLYLDRVHWISAGLLEIEGWGMGADARPLQGLVCQTDDDDAFRPALTFGRRDVRSVHPQVHDQACGFVFRVPGLSETKHVHLRFRALDVRHPPGELRFFADIVRDEVDAVLHT